MLPCLDRYGVTVKVATFETRPSAVTVTLYWPAARAGTVAVIELEPHAVVVATVVTGVAPVLVNFTAPGM